MLHVRGGRAMLMEERVRKKKEKSKLNQITVGKYRSIAPREKI